jgi:uncharacterized protein YutE (UPF0331/DUF86 family)
LTDETIILRKLTSLREHLARIKRRSATDLASFQRDVDLQDALGMSVMVAVQDALDIALHVAADEGWGIPASYAESFGLLADHGMLPRELAATLSGMAALRNRIAHGYASVDMERIFHEIPAGIVALEAFSVAIARQGRK